MIIRKRKIRDRKINLSIIIQLEMIEKFYKFSLDGMYFV